MPTAVRFGFVLAMLALVAAPASAQNPAATSRAINRTSRSAAATATASPGWYPPSTVVFIENRARTLGDQVSASGTRISRSGTSTCSGSPRTPSSSGSPRRRSAPSMAYARLRSSSI